MDYPLDDKALVSFQGNKMELTFVSHNSSQKAPSNLQIFFHPIFSRTYKMYMMSILQRKLKLDVLTYSISPSNDKARIGSQFL